MLAEIETFLSAAETVGAEISADAVDGGGNPGLEIGRQRNVAELGEALLSGGDGRLHECLYRRTHLSVRVFGADEFVAGQQDRVSARRSGGVYLREVENEVVALTFDGDVRDGLANPVVADADDAADGLDSGHIEVLLHRIRPFVVADRALGFLDGFRRALVALGGGSYSSVEGLAGALGPGATRCGLQVLLEVVAGSGCVAAGDDVDVLGGHVSVQRGDGRVVPTRDGAAEDLGGRGGGEVEGA